MVVRPKGEGHGKIDSCTAVPTLGEPGGGASPFYELEVGVLVCEEGEGRGGEEREGEGGGKGRVRRGGDRGRE